MNQTSQDPHRVGQIWSAPCSEPVQFSDYSLCSFNRCQIHRGLILLVSNCRQWKLRNSNHLPPSKHLSCEAFLSHLKTILDLLNLKATKPHWSAGRHKLRLRTIPCRTQSFNHLIDVLPRNCNQEIIYVHRDESIVLAFWISLVNYSPNMRFTSLLKLHWKSTGLPTEFLHGVIAEGTPVRWTLCEAIQGLMHQPFVGGSCQPHLLDQLRRSHIVGLNFALLLGACKKAAFTSKDAIVKSRWAARFNRQRIATVSTPPTDGSGSPGWSCLAE